MIIPTRNRAGWLDACLESLAVQHTSRPFEVVVADNASEDDTEDVVRARSRRDGRFSYVCEEVLGRSAALNAGIAVSQGMLLLFTDDDVILDPGWIEGYARHMLSPDGRPHTWDLAGGPLMPVHVELREWPRWLTEDALLELPSVHHGSQARSLSASEIIWGANMAAPKATFERLGAWDVQLGHRGEDRGRTWEDLDLQQRVRKDGGSVGYAPEALVWHRTAPDFVTQRAVLESAFGRGRNQARWAETSPPSWTRVSVFLDERPSRKCSLLDYVSWMWWALLFRARPAQVGWFTKARAAAWRSGWALQEMLPQPPASLRERVLQKFVHEMRALALKVSRS
ncbi:N/A [soil metagenome]